MLIGFSGVSSHWSATEGTAEGEQGAGYEEM